LTSKQTEKLNVVRDQHTALTTVVADQRIVEIPIERAEGIGAPHNRGVDNWVVIRVGRHNTRSGTRENNLRNVLCSKIAELFNDLAVGEFRRSSDPLVGKHPLQFL
jgi:hypothetical protein